MSAQFKNFLVELTLTSGVTLQGIVTDVVDRTLILSQGKYTPFASYYNLTQSINLTIF